VQHQVNAPPAIDKQYPEIVVINVDPNASEHSIGSLTSANGISNNFWPSANIDAVSIDAGASGEEVLHEQQQQTHSGQARTRSHTCFFNHDFANYSIP
jgi:cytochrome oxidase assembly protein ShyY1